MENKFGTSELHAITGQGLEEIITNTYSLKGPVKLQLFHSGLNDTYMVQTVDGTHYFRMSRAKLRAKEQIEAEVDLLRHLDGDGIPVVVPLPNLNGEFVQEINASGSMWWGVLFTEAKGNVDRNPTVERNYLIGKTLARIHNSTDNTVRSNSRPKMDSRYLLDEPLALFKPYLEHRSSDFAYLEGICDILKRRIDGLPSSYTPQYGLCHGDYTNRNMHFDEHGNLCVFDFDCCGYGWRAYDLACYLFGRLEIQYFSTEEMTPDTWESFVKGYSDERSLSSEELHAIDLFIPIRMMWCRGIHITFAQENPNMEPVGDTICDLTVEFIRNWVVNHNIT